MRSNEAENAPFVVAVSGVPGSGKTTLVRRVLRLMPNASPLYFDCYQSVATWCPRYNPEGELSRDKQAMLQHWLDNGAAADDYVSVPQLTPDLETLIRGERIIMPQPTHAGEQVVDPAQIILVEDPFGRERSELGPLVDFVVHLEASLDIALGRCVLRASRANVDPYHFIRGYLNRNITQLNQRFAKVRRFADVVLDADQLPMIIAKQMRDAVYDAAEAAGHRIDRSHKRPSRILNSLSDDDIEFEAAFEDDDPFEADEDAPEKSGMHGTL